MSGLFSCLLNIYHFTGAVFLRDVKRDRTPSLYAEAQVKTPTSPWSTNPLISLENKSTYHFFVPAAPELKSANFTRDRDESWKCRPPAAEIYERLEEFFPDEELDEPVVEETSAGISHPGTQPALATTREPIRSPKKGNSSANIMMARLFIRNRSNRYAP